MYHISNLGRFDKGVRAYSDLNGFVPQRGDRFEQFHYDTAFESEPWTHEDWDAFVEQANIETEAALLEIHKWRRSKFVSLVLRNTLPVGSTKPSL